MIELNEPKGLASRLSQMGSSCHWPLTIWRYSCWPAGKFSQVRQTPFQPHLRAQAEGSYSLKDPASITSFASGALGLKLMRFIAVFSDFYYGLWLLYR